MGGGLESRCVGGVYGADGAVHGCVTAFGPDTHPSCLHLTSNQQQLENQTAYVVINDIVVSS